jgi:hypothetical protein
MPNSIILFVYKSKQKTMKKTILSCLICSISIASFAQNVGIGTTAPTAKLHLVGSGGILIYANNSGASGYGIVGESNGATAYGVRGLSGNGIGVYGESGTGTGVKGYGNNAGSVAVFGSALAGTGVKAFSYTGMALEVIGNLKISDGNTNPVNGAVLTSDAVGNAVWKPRRIAFKAFGVHANYSIVPDETSRRVQFGGEAFDPGNDYELLAANATATSSSSVFTAPVSGIYHFDVDATLRASNLLQDIEDASMQLFRNRNGVETQLAIGTAVRSYRYANASEQPDQATFLISTNEALQAGDKIYVVVYQNSGTDLNFVNDYRHRFTGFLVYAD